MALIIGVVSQKGGVGKSTVSRMIARELAHQEWSVKIADLDISQATNYHWRTRRLQNSIEPDVPVEQFGRVEQALKLEKQYDLIVLDGAPHASQATRKIAESSNLVIIPTGLAVDDLQPGVTLANELAKVIDRSRIVFVLCRVGNSPQEILEARQYLSQANFEVLKGELPEKVAYRRASDEGRSATETKFPTLCKHAEEVTQSIIDKLGQLNSTPEDQSHGDRHESTSETNETNW